MKHHDKIIVALDTPDLNKVRELVTSLKDTISYFKVGFELFAAHGWKAVELVKKSGSRIFLDMKLHDIPNTVSKTLNVLCEHDVDMVTVHTLGGSRMMKQTAEVVAAASKNGGRGPAIVGVTILTSHSQQEIERDLGISRPLEEQVIHLASLAKESGLNGVVCSPHEIAKLRAKFSSDFLIVTPGIRPAGGDHGDQKRVMTPKEALDAGASFLVIGRPITEAEDPAEVALQAGNG